MKIVYEFMSWLFGSLFLLASITIVSDSRLAGLVFLLIALLLLPPFRQLIYRLTKKELEPAARAVSILLLLISFGFIISHDAKIKTQSMSNTIEAPELNQTKTLAGK